jgi:hypothetical protein
VVEVRTEAVDCQRATIDPEYRNVHSHGLFGVLGHVTIRRLYDSKYSWNHGCVSEAELNQNLSRSSPGIRSAKSVNTTNDA